MISVEQTSQIQTSQIMKKLIFAAAMFIMVTFFSFLLIAHFGSDLSYVLLGKHAEQADLENLREHLGFNIPLWQRYLTYIYEILTCNFGHSHINHESVVHIIQRALPISLALNIPGFVLGNLIAVLLALFASYHRGHWQDRLITFSSSVGMSLSFLIVVIGFQALLCSSRGFNLFPVQGWRMDSLSSYFEHIFVPTLATVTVTVGYNLRFFRALMVEEMRLTYVRSARSFGWSPWRLMLSAVLRNTLIPIFTRIVFSVPFVFVEGCVLIESFFGIPGMGGVIYNAIVSGDLPILKAVISLGVLLYIVLWILADFIYKTLDPRVRVV